MITGRIPSAVAVLGLAIGLVGLFALPQQLVHEPYSDLEFDYADLHRQVAPARYANYLPPGSRGFADIWWSYVLLVAVAVITLLVAVLAVTSLRWVAAGLAVLAVAVAVTHAVVLHKTSVTFPYTSTSRAPKFEYDQYAAGAWTAFAGLAVVAVAGVLAALSARRNTERAA